MRERKHNMNRYMSSLFIYMHLFRCFKIGDSQTMQQEISGNGFHRTLTYYVKMQLMDRNCSFMIVQQVPVNLFVDVDELQNLEAFGGPNHPFSKYVDMQTRISYKVVTESAIDTEQPSYNAREHILYIHPAVYENHSTMTLFEVWLPIHVRYQRPVPSGSKAILTMKNGRLYSNCSNSFQADEYLMDICNGSHAVGDNCKWKFLLEFTKRKEGSSIKIPTGNKDHAIAVTVITLLTTCMSSLLVLRIALQC